MVGTFFNYQAGTPEQTSPYNNMLSRAIKGYSQAQQLKYQPRMLEAELLSKQLGPLAQLGVSTQGMIFAGPQGAQARQLLSDIIQQSRQAQQGQQQGGGMFSRMFGGGGQPQQQPMQQGGQSQGGQYMPGNGQNPNYPNQENEGYTPPKSPADEAISQATHEVTSEKTTPLRTYLNDEGKVVQASSQEMGDIYEKANFHQKTILDGIQKYIKDLNDLGGLQSMTKGLVNKLPGKLGKGINLLENQDIKADQRALVDALIPGLGISKEQAEATVTPGSIEDVEKIKKRLIETQDKLIDRIKRAGEIRRKGLSLENQGKSESQHGYNTEELQQESERIANEATQYISQKYGKNVNIPPSVIFQYINTHPTSIKNGTISGKELLKIAGIRP